MMLPKCAILLGLILTLLLDPISGKRGFGGGHSYPKSGGLSGGGHRSGGLSGGGHSYPSSGGNSGGGHGYPSSGGGLSGGGHGYPSSGGGLSGGNHGYPSSGGNHGYPSSGGSHGYPPAVNKPAYPSSGGSHTYPTANNNHGYPPAVNKPAYPSSGGSHTYPTSNNNHGYPVGSGSSGGSHTYPTSNKNHGYPAGPGLSGGGRGYPANKPATTHTTHHTTKVYHHYHYTPPAQISYAPVRGAPPVSYPVYRGTPPTYVYQYKDSGSKYGTLLAGLALMNLGTLGVAAYAAHKATHNSGPGGSSYTYTPQKGEVCKFAVKKENGDYEETRIDCQIISGFILQDMEAQKTAHPNTNTVTTTTTQTNVTIVNTTNVGGDQTTTAVPKVIYEMLSNGTLVPVNTTRIQIPELPGVVTLNATAPNNQSSSTVVTTTTTTTNSTLVSALDVKGKPVEVTPGMQCFVIRNSPISNMRKSVPCGLLQTYADKSLKRNSATRNMPVFTVVVAVLAYVLAY